MTQKLTPVAVEKLTPKGQRRIDEICHSATKVLSEKGYWATSMNDIATATGVSKGGLYHYFQTKEQLLFLIMQRYIDLMLTGLTSDLAKIDTPGERVKFLVQRHIKLYANNIYESRLMFHDMHLLPENLFKMMIKKSREYRRIWTETVLALGRGSGISDTQLTLATLSLLGMSNWIYLWYDPQGPIDEEQLADHICDVFLGRFGQQVCAT